MDQDTDEPPRLAFDVRFRDRVGSTSDELRLLAAGGAPHGTVLRAAEQTSGRGRRGRHWSSPPGNLHMSVLLRGAYPARCSAELGFVAGLAVADAVDRVLPPGVRARLKWPNDVLIAGAKVAGVLVEHAERGDGTAEVIVGIGLNVAHAPSGLPYAAACLRDHCTTPLDPEAMLELVLSAFAARWQAWSRHGFGQTRENWLQRGPLPGARLRVTLPDGVLDGLFEDLDPDGALVLRTPGGLRRIVAGDVAANPDGGRLMDDAG